MKCPNCGQEMNNAAFCISCGQRLTGNLSAAPQKRNKAPLIIISGILAIVLIICVACILLFQPFDSKTSTDLSGHLATEPVVIAPQNTEGTQKPQIKPNIPNLPENARPVGAPEGENVGLPVPKAQPEALQAAYDVYWEFLGNRKAALEYGLIDFLGDEIPEIIVKEQQDDSTSVFSIYYTSDGAVLQLTTDKISATADVQLLSVDGTLMVIYSNGFTNYVTVDKTMNATVKLVKTDVIPDYKDSAILVSATDRSLLDLYLLGSYERFSGEGWIRMNGTDYYYRYGKPCTNQWIEENNLLYYLGDRACITEVASQAMLSDVIDAYFVSYETAFNEKNAALLEYATENNQADQAQQFELNENKHLTISNLTWESVSYKGNDTYGSIDVNLHLKYSQIGDWENASETSESKNRRVTLVWNDGQWYVDHIGNG